ncbi:hypothetical protein COS81_04960 [candidate division WWE3 bacterium CG06_land_8_20_14_3_00_42_16]|uniref:YokE-like PH domain-containing protein n=3 Tax=Katanobacteria TaxID=422282 RepID=A0A2M7AL81_UNCKA|nr:MAG: hypothetical protein AUJ38_03125 [bacterium CG1_02_42_9]PIU68156.1 MAG: hypothetical protein COS81_04960 [candidate division WWE3 bacterium CG06_land_8_20_14_3_00_42_16]PIZ42354.1 MAG: hypothetical protein COY34_02995 [candidate division WWE3 bacterium CG_4_10_14_0_2_um_filter_42_8]PJC69423.1 MAG: hypothetical protein CO015_00315 [candidate division WWE3 bacterium CG_4_8_14_3_um_filter_42_11]
MEIPKDELSKFIKKRIDFDPSEQVFLVRQKHWFVFRNPFLIGVFVPFILVFFALLLSYSQFSLPSFLSKNLAEYVFYFAPAVVVLGFFLFLWKLYLWQRTFYVVTSRRIIIIRQNNLFSADVHQISLDKTQDVITKIKGLQAALYGFGDVSIQASSSTAQLVFSTVGKPHEVQRKVMEAVESYRI